VIHGFKLSHATWYRYDAALTAECDKASGGAVDLAQFIAVVRGLRSGADNPPEASTVEALFKAMDTDGGAHGGTRNYRGLGLASLRRIAHSLYICILKPLN
jgi:hypothetical protein